MEAIQCPVCCKDFEPSLINEHVNQCLNATESEDMSKRQHTAAEDQVTEPCHLVKRQKTGDPAVGAWSFLMSGKQTSPQSAKSKVETTVHADSSKAKPEPNTSKPKPLGLVPSTSDNAVKDLSPRKLSKTDSAKWGAKKDPGENIPLPERMRPKTFKDYVGQEKVLGRSTLLRSLLEADKVPSMIIWGPPGCGKVFCRLILILLQLYLWYH